MYPIIAVIFLCLTHLTVGQEEEESSFKKKVLEDHSYYKMELYKENFEGAYDRHLVDMSGATVHEFLSNHSQAAEAVSPEFEFPFYGHKVDRFYVTTHGFLSFAPRLHNLMYKTQYVAPLRVKLDPSASEEATVSYLSFPDRLTVQWSRVPVAEPHRHPAGGLFTFQTTLFQNGDVQFVYLKVPDLLTADALYDDEPVAGLSDAFLIGDSELHVYHTMNVQNPDIMSKTVVRFRAKPTCVQQESCAACASLRESSEFECAWCEKVQRCSDGADRLREHWDAESCHANNVTGVGACENVHNSKGAGHIEWRSSMPLEKGSTEQAPPPQIESSSTSPLTVVSGVVSAILLLVLLLLLVGFVYVYGRSNPGGWAERLALRLEANYKRFGGMGGAPDFPSEGRRRQQQVELTRREFVNRTAVGDNDEEDVKKISNNNNNSNYNNNNITVSF